MSPPARLTFAVATAVAAAWAVAAGAGGFVFGSFHVAPAAAAAACGLALVAAAGPLPRTYAVAEGFTAALLVGTFAVAGGGRGTARLLAGGALALAALGLRRWPPSLAAVSGVAGAVGFAAVILAGRDTLLRSDVAAGALTAAGGLLAFAATGPDRPAARAGSLLHGGRHLLIVPAVLALLTGASALPVTAATLVLAAAAIAAAARHQPAPLVLAVLAGAAAAVPAARPAALLLAAASTLALALATPFAITLGLPGLASLGAVLATGPATAARVALATAAAGVAVAGALAVRAERFRLPSPNRLPAAIAGGWLLVAPATWGWAGATALGPYGSGAARATAVALLVVIGTALKAVAGKTPPHGSQNFPPTPV